jgi:hypothetical protein
VAGRLPQIGESAADVPSPYDCNLHLASSRSG